MAPYPSTFWNLQRTKTYKQTKKAKSPFCAAAFLLLGLLCSWPSAAQGQGQDSDTKAAFRRARNAFAYGNYGDAVQRFRELLYPAPGKLKSGKLKRKSHKFLGVSYYYLHLRTKQKRYQKASEREFTRLLILNPKAKLDPLLYPPNLINFFEKVKLANRRRLEAILRRRQQQRNATKVQIVPLQVERHYYASNPLIAAIPFGVPQFVNRQPTKAWLLLSGQAASLGLNIVAYFAIYARQIKDGDQRGRFRTEDISTVRAWQIVQFSSLGVFAALVVYGIVDGAVYLQRRRVTVLPQVPPVDTREFRQPAAPQTQTFSIPMQ